MPRGDPRVRRLRASERTRRVALRGLAGSRAPTRFVHLFVWKDEAANRIHGESAAVRKFAGILYPNCLAPVEFVKYRQVDANAAFRRVD